jgi:hypothetical protein
LRSDAMNIKIAVEPIKIPFALSLSKGGRGFDRLTQWVGMWKPLMVRLAHHERFPHASTAFFKMKHLMPIATVGALLLATGCEPARQWNGQTFAKDASQTPYPQTADYSNPESTNVSPESGLINILVNQLGVKPQQALGGAGSIFALAQQRMNPSDFMQLSGSVPGMDRYLSAVPRPASSSSWLSTSTDSTEGESTGLGSLSALTDSFQALGLNTKLISQFVPVVLQYVQTQNGGPAAMDLLQSALY